MTLSEPSGRVRERMIPIRSERQDNLDSIADITVLLILNLFIPMLAIGLGFMAVFIRPRDGNAWLLLLLLLDFSEMARRGDWPGIWPTFTTAWEGFWSG
ncbi:MAG: hypothetical protein M3N54_16125 [Acidobacteriota bacterium]|nr:hypothetical protein [Acidobacteriota bacterium]